MKRGDALNSTHIYFTIRGRGNIWDLPHYLNHFQRTQSSERGWMQKSQLPGLTEKANTQAHACLPCAVRSQEGQKQRQHQRCQAPGVFMFSGSPSQVPWERTLAADPDHFQAHLTIKLHSNSWLMFLKNVWNYCNLFPSCTLLFKPFKRNHTPETSLVVKRLRLYVPNTGGPGSIPDQGTSSHVLQLTISTCCNWGPTQPNK